MEERFDGEVTEKVTRSFSLSTTVDWLITVPVGSGPVIRTMCIDYDTNKNHGQRVNERVVKSILKQYTILAI